jgi:hypothetical protein
VQIGDQTRLDLERHQMAQIDRVSMLQSRHVVQELGNFAPKNNLENSQVRFVQWQNECVERSEQSDIEYSIECTNTHIVHNDIEQRRVQLLINQFQLVHEQSQSSEQRL